MTQVLNGLVRRLEVQAEGALMRWLLVLAWAAIGMEMLAVTPTQAEPAGHVTGVGGIFIKSKDPKALAAWYRDVLGLQVKSWGGAVMPYDAPGHPPVTTWSAFPETSDYMAPSTRDVMINFAVDDMDAIVARLTSKGVHIVGRDDKDPHGRFTWILDPDGTKIELWQPK